MKKFLFVCALLASGSVYAVENDYRPYVGVDYLYTNLNAKRIDSYGKMKSSLQGYGLDMFAYLPLGCENRFAPYATAGIGKYALKKKVAGVHHNDKDGTGYRFGGGLSYRFDTNLSLKVGYR